MSYDPLRALETFVARCIDWTAVARKKKAAPKAPPRPKRLKREHAAMPEIAVMGTDRDNGTRWTVEELMNGPARCNPENRSLVVPLSNSDADRDVRLHELGHGRISPDCNSPEVTTLVRDVGERVVAVTEDARVNVYLQKHVRTHDYTQGRWSKELTPEQVGDMTLEELACLQVAHRGLDSYDALRRTLLKAARKLHRRDVEKALLEIHDACDEADAWSHPLTDFRYTENLAHDIRRLLGEYRPEGTPDTPVGTVPTPTPGTSGGDETLGKSGMFTPDPRAPGSDVPEASGDIDWCPMQIARPKLPRWHDAARRAMGYVAPSDHGTRIRFPHRLLSGGSVFVRRTPDALKGGTWLIDRSGSMRIDEEDIDALVDAAPAGTIATYSGNGRMGRLTVLAHKGRRIRPGDPDAESIGGGNCCDGPALRWLLMQSEPRVWVCDGVVTGVGDETSGRLKAECEKLRARGNVTRIHSVRLAVAAAKASKHGARHS